MIVPYGNRVLVKPDEKQDKFDSKIDLEIPEAYRLFSTFGTIEKIGSEVDSKMYDIYEGMRVVIPRYVGADITVEGVLYKFLDPGDLLCEIEKGVN